MYQNAETLSIFIVPKERLECDFREFFSINSLDVNLCTTENLEHYQKQILVFQFEYLCALQIIIIWNFQHVPESNFPQL